uniref:Exosome complex component MTR3 n=1 Tax=Crassostrea virginica TaxID=6565 RepID=A0A8B8BAC7_CRAVI|nr:exosome complex component MTR3-like [Crassostrea virginica]
MNCRLGLDWIACVVQLVGAIFFTIGFSTKYWATSDNSVNAGLFTTCDGGYCYDTHVFYHGKSEKATIMGAAVLQIFTLCGVIFVLLLMLLYMCGLFNERSVSRGAAITAFATALFGFIGVIMYGSAMSSLQYSLSWSCAFVIIGLIVDIAAGICIYIGGQQWEETQKKQRKRELFPPIKSSRLDPRLDPRIPNSSTGVKNNSSKLFNPKASPQLSRKFRNMPTDSRRITGPEESFDPSVLLVNREKTKEAVFRKGKRKDGRKAEQVRPVFLKAGVISQARGSAYIEQNETKVMCAVYGPREVMKKEEFSMKGQLTCEFKFATFSCRVRRQYQQDNEEKDYSSQLQDALEPAVCLHKFPKAQVNVYITVLQNDGCALAASLTCASVALANAGIEMYDLVVGCSARITPSEVFIDPTETEDYNPENDNETGNGSVTVGLLPSLNQVSAVTSRGEVEFQLLNKGTKQCIDVCQKLYPVLQQAVAKAVEDRLSSDHVT